MDDLSSCELTVRLVAAADGYDVELLCRGSKRALGRVEPSGDALMPWANSIGQLEVSAEVAALKLAAAALEDDGLSLATQLY